MRGGGGDIRMIEQVPHQKAFVARHIRRHDT